MHGETIQVFILQELKTSTSGLPHHGVLLKIMKIEEDAILRRISLREMTPSLGAAHQVSLRGETLALQIPKKIDPVSKNRTDPGAEIRMFISKCVHKSEYLSLR